MEYNYSEELVEALALIDYEIIELKIICDYFKDKLEKKNTGLNFYKKATQQHIEYINRLFFILKKVKIKLIINDKLESNKEFKGLIDMNLSTQFGAYSEEFNNECLKNYFEQCENYLNYMNQLKECLFKMAKH